MNNEKNFLKSEDEKTIKNSEFFNIFNFSKSYKGKVIFKNVNCSFESGKVYALLAPNGFGKTTMMKCIAQLCSYEGSIVYKSVKVKDGNFNDKISFSSSISVFENFSVKVIDYIHQICMLKGINFFEVFSKFQNLEISELSENQCKSLSTGQKKSLQIFVDLLLEPDFIMLDEPLNGLDHKNRNLSISNIVNLSNLGKTILLSTHILNDVEEIVDYVIVIKDQNLVFYPVDKSDQVKEIYEKNYIYVT